MGLRPLRSLRSETSFASLLFLLSLFIEKMKSPPPASPRFLIEPCFTQKATVSLLRDRRLCQHPPSSALDVERQGPPITALLYMIMEVMGAALIQS